MTRRKTNGALNVGHRVIHQCHLMYHVSTNLTTDKENINGKLGNHNTKENDGKQLASRVKYGHTPTYDTSLLETIYGTEDR